MNPDKRIRPVIIIPPKTLSKKDIKKMSENGFCVVEAEDPSKVRYLDTPPPYDYSDQERAAIQLCKVLLSSGVPTTNWQKMTITEKFIELLIKGSPLQAAQPQPVATVPPATKK
jgi:hypothetical protein